MRVQMSVTAEFSFLKKQKVKIIDGGDDGPLLEFKGRIYMPVITFMRQDQGKPGFYTGIVSANGVDPDGEELESRMTVENVSSLTSL